MEELERIEGRNSVLEALRGGRHVEKIFIAREAKRSGTLRKITALAAEKGTPVFEITKRQISRIAPSEHHQGVVALVTPFAYQTLDDLIRGLNEEKPGLLLALDGVEDPRNLGALMRIADGCGVDGIIVSKRRSTPVTSTVLRTSAGAAEYVRVARVANVSSALLRLKDAGLWIVGVEVSGSVPYYSIDYTKPTCVVLGGEGKGLGRLTAERCDVVVRIPMLGKVESLNVAAAGAVVLFEAARQRS